jgi:hypothetical protein
MIIIIKKSHLIIVAILVAMAEKLKGKVSLMSYILLYKNLLQKSKQAW